MNKEQKQARIERAKRHAEQDQLIDGTYGDWSGDVFMGCSVGCDAAEILPDTSKFENTNLHLVVANHDGTPEWLEQLRDTIFEGLPDEEKRSWWHVTLAESLPITDDWEPYRHQILIQILKFTLTLKNSWPESLREQTVAAIEKTIAYHREPSEIKRIEAKSAAESARLAARSAAESAWLAAESARLAAESAAESAWLAAESAWSAAESAAAESARPARSAAESAWSAAESVWSARSAARSAAFVTLAEAIVATFKRERLSNATCSF